MPDNASLPPLSIFIDAVETAGEVMAALWPREVMRGVSMLAHSLALAGGVSKAYQHRGGAVSSITVLTSSKECAAEAKRLGVGAIVVPPRARQIPGMLLGSKGDAGGGCALDAARVLPPWPPGISSPSQGECQVVLKLAAPLITVEQAMMLLTTVATSTSKSQGMVAAEVVVPATRHPIGSYLTKQNTMDFSLTMDRADWRELEEARVMHLSLAIRARCGKGDVGEVKLVQGDEVSCLRVLGDADFFVAQRVLASGALSKSDGGTKNVKMHNQLGGTPWRVL